MSVIEKVWQRFIGGIADFDHEGSEDSYYFGRSIDVRKNPKHFTILRKTVKESGTVVIGLPKWGESTGDGNTYVYDDAGDIYKRVNSSRTWSLLRTISASHGNGMGYNKEDDYVYYTSDKLIGRYGPLSATPSFTDDYFGSQGGLPLNTNSLSLVAASSQYAAIADNATLSITGDLSIEAQIHMTSLPTVGNSMTIAGKWDETGATRSYKFDIYALSGYFGDGSDGALTIAADTTEAPIDSACTGTTGTTALTATNASFAAGQIVLIHQTRGTGAGTWQRNAIYSYTAGTVTLTEQLNASYVSGAQVRVLKQYTNVTVNSGKTYTAKAWNGTVGGILAFLASGTVTVTGSITATGKGYLGHTPPSTAKYQGEQGEGTSGAGGTASTAANGNGGGGGSFVDGSGTSGGGGGGNATAGETGHKGGTAIGGVGGGTSGSADLTTMTFGGGGGTASGVNEAVQTGIGSPGGGIIFITGTTITVGGSIVANGNDGGNSAYEPAGGGGAGGSILLKAQVATLGTGLITANGGARGIGSVHYGGAGGAGRIHLDYYTSYTGTTTPTLDVVVDSNLVTTTTYRLRLLVSTDGTVPEILYKDLVSMPTDTWQQVGVTWDASASTATFYQYAASLGTAVGALTAIHDNASAFAVGANVGAAAYQNFFNGLIDEVRVYNAVKTESDFLYGSNKQIAVGTPNLVAYYKFNANVNDATAGALHLTASGAPTYSTDVPFASPTTRLDIDQKATETTQTYAVPTAISEAAADRLTITPEKDPQKSIRFYIANKGTGTWTVTVHDTNNNVKATSTVVTGSMTTGDYEFTFSSVWRPLTNFTEEYHVHLVCASGSPTVQTSASNNLEKADFTTYYQFLVEDTAWHPVTKFLNFMVFGNERYVGKLEATLYEPNKIVLPSGWRVRCFALWQEYLCIGVMKGTNIYDNDEGRIYFWDGYAPTFNFYIPVPEGGINAMVGSANKLFFTAGYRGDLLVYTGGNNATKVKRVPKLADGTYVETYPGAMNVWQTLLRWGVAGGSDDTTIEKGVYTWGSLNVRYEDCLTYDYPISPKVYTGNNVKIGLILPVGQELLIGYQSGSSAYGVDYVNNTNDYFDNAYMEMLIEDMDTPHKEKLALVIAANLDPLKTGDHITLKWRNDENETEEDFHSDTQVLAVGDSLIRENISAGRYHHFHVKCELESTGATAPNVHDIVLRGDMLENEEVIG